MVLVPVYRYVLLLSGCVPGTVQWQSIQMVRMDGMYAIFNYGVMVDYPRTLQPEVDTIKL